MREIWCRGRRLDNGEWVEGYFWKEFDERCFIGADVGTEWDCQKYRTIVEVIPETVGEYTGLKDKNGKEIFAGDIVSAWSQGLQAIGDVRARIDGLWLMYPAYQHGKFWGLCPNPKGGTSVEIVGNIHENPELIER